ncbi:MAG: FAD-binding protein [Syntrophorhabdaceae bacterium]|nr:FAD-binding protein [Syntrophorhabdaceae bacterium]
MSKQKKTRPKVRLITEKCIACGRCEPSCTVNALEYDTHDTKGTPIVNYTKCIGCKKCLRACPVGAFELVYILKDEKCNGCGECIKVCQVNAIEYDTLDTKGIPIINLGKCNRCKKCIDVCKIGALEDFKELTNRDIDDSTSTEKISTTEKIKWESVWVFIEHFDGKANQVSWELLGIGSQLASELSTDLSAILLGHNVEHLVLEAFGYGADKVYLIDHPTLKYYRTRPYLDCIVYLVNKYHPEILLMGATGLGRDLASAVATALKTGLTADCTKLSIDKEKRLLEQTRPAFGGNVMATILTEHARPQMASVRPMVLPMPPFKERYGELIRETIELKEEDIATKILEIIPVSKGDENDIRTANIVVSGGKGMLEKKNFSLLEELASLLGGVVGGSRCAVDAGWITHDRQIGQTGKTIRPKLYLACGISGAIQHIVGMQNAEHIIAINKDKNAPIFEIAHVGIVGDVFEILPTLITSLKEKANMSQN